MAKVLDTLTGEVREVPDDIAAPQLKKSPRFQDVSSGRVEVAEPSGRRGTVPLADLQKAAAAGMTFLPGGAVEEERLQEEYGKQYLKGNAEALARGLTVGISDELLTQTGAVTPEALRERRERVPGTTISELAGAIAPTLIPGVGEATVSGQVAKLGAAAGKKLATGATGRAVVSGAVEGGLYGLGGLLTEHSAGNTELSAEKAVAAMGTGALFGAGTGYVISKGGQKLARALGRVEEPVAGEGGALALREADDLVAPAGQSARVDSALAQKADDALGGVRAGGEAGAARAAQEVGGARAAGDVGGVKVPPPEPSEFSGGVGNAQEVKRAVESAAKKDPGVFRRLFEAFDLPFPDADNFVLRGLDAKKGQLKKLRTSGLLRDAPAELRADPRFRGVPGDERWANGVKTGEDAAELIQLKLREAAERYGSALDKLDAARLPDEGVDGFELARRIQRNVLEPLRAGPAANEPAAQAVEAEIQKLLSMADEQGKLTLRATEDVKRGFDPFAQFNRSTPPPEASRAMAYRDMREQVKKAVEEHADSISKRLGGDDALQFRSSKRSMQRLYSLEEIAKDRLEDAKTANRVFSLTDNIGGFVAGALGGGLTPSGIAAGLGVALLNKWGRENLPWVLAKALTRYEESAPARLATRGLRKLVEQADDDYRAAARSPRLSGGPEPLALPPGPAGGGQLRLPSGLPELPASTALARASQEEAERLAPRLSTGEKVAGEAAVHPGGLGAGAPLPDVGHPFGRWADTLRRAAVAGERELWLTHVLLSKDPEYRSTLQELGGADFSPEGDNRAQRRGTALEALGGFNARFDSRAEGAITGFLKNSPKPRSASVPEAQHLEKAQSVLKLSTNPETLTTAISAELGSLPEHAPATAEGMGAVMARAVQFLSSKAPKEPEQPMGEVQALRRPFRPSPTEVARFARYLAAVEDPGGVLEDMAGGLVTREAVEAMEQVYPTLWGELRGKLVERLATAGSSLDYRQRLALGQVLGPQVVVAASPRALEALQSTFDGPPAGESAGRAPAPPPDGKVGKRIYAEQSAGDKVVAH